MSGYESQNALWYVVHTYSGYENKVKDTLMQIVENRHLQDFIQQVDVPVENQVEIKDGKKKVVQRKLYPGYVLIKMRLTDEIWYIVRNTRGVTGFIGGNSSDPVPLTEEDLQAMGLVGEVTTVMDYAIGDSVRVIHGPLESFVGTVTEVNMLKKKVTVMLSMFGRETPVELDFVQVAQI